MPNSPYSANMNLYQTIYNNSGAPAYQPTWGYTDLFAHVVDWDSELPLGYTRQQYNEERALAAESMWKSPLLGLNTFALGTVASHVAFGSPLQNLSRLVGGVSGSAAFNAGFGGPANLGVSRWEALQGYSAARATGDLNAINAARQNIGLVNTQIATFNAQTSSFWGRVGSLSRGISAFKEGMTEATASIIRYNDDYASFYHSKRNEVKVNKHKRALVLTSRKFVRLVYGMLRDHKLFDDHYLAHRS